MTLTIGEAVAIISVLCAVFTVIVGVLRVQNDRQQKQIDDVKASVSKTEAKFTEKTGEIYKHVAEIQRALYRSELRTTERFGLYPTREQLGVALDDKLDPINEGMARVNQVIDDVLRSGLLRRTRNET